jgi:hypothetical protein
MVRLTGKRHNGPQPIGSPIEDRSLRLRELLQRLGRAHPGEQRCIVPACPYRAMLDGRCRAHALEQYAEYSPTGNSHGRAEVLGMIEPDEQLPKRKCRTSREPKKS